MYIVLSTLKYKITSYSDNFLITLIICITKQLFRLSEVQINKVLLFINNSNKDFSNKLNKNNLGESKKLLFNNGGTSQSSN